MSFARIFIALGLVALVACDPDEPAIDHQKITQTTNQTLTTHIQQINHAAQLVLESPFFDGFNHVAQPNDPEPDGLIEISDAEIAEIIGEVNARVFTEAAIEEQTETRVLYRLRSALVCESNEELCQQILDQVAVWLEVTSPVEGAIDIRVLVGETTNPVTMHLSESGASAEIDVAAVKAAAMVFAPHFELDVNELPDTALGKFSLAVTKNAELDYSASFRVLEAITIASDDPSQEFAVSIAAKNSDLVSLRVDGAAQRVFAQVDFAELDAAIPASMFLPALVCGSDETDCGPFNGTLSAHLAGASAAVTLHESLERLAITGVGLGAATSFVRYNENELLTVDVNSLNGRRFDVELSTIDDYLEAKVQSAFTLDLGLDLAPLNAEGADLPTWTGDETFSVSLDGAAEPRIRLGDGGQHDIGGRRGDLVASMVEGELTLSAAQYAPVSVAASNCLYFDHDYDDDSAHPFSAMISYACP